MGDNYRRAGTGRISRMFLDSAICAAHADSAVCARRLDFVGCYSELGLDKSSQVWGGRII